MRGIVQSADLDRLLEKLRHQRARLISVTPLHGTLEDYFLAKTEREGDGFPMTSRLSAITLNTFREAVRDRVLYNLVLFVLLLVASAPLFGEISIGLERLILVNVGLSSISLFGVIIAIFIGIGLVSKEIEKKTLYTILSRPVRRWEFIAGKYFGLLLTLVVNTAMMTVGFYSALLISAHSLHSSDALLWWPFTSSFCNS